CQFEGDEHELTFHLGAFDESKLVSVASFYYQNNPTIQQEHQFRLRGMATLPEFRGKGFSKALLKIAFPLIKQSLCDTVWCNARKMAYGFYQKVGFDFKGEEFDVPQIGPHTLMTKKLN
ncbi:MAG: GNAT family N-acetyltransferase, partial [Halobacteriovoraceae bacterium]|nr:GNAT family N-acetyltransferase [Halobacteriovoraceae bacterium]